MLASRLPFEILALIASFVPKFKRSECSTVCKAWKTPFQDSLWHSLRINRILLKLIIYLPNEENIYKKNGHRVRELQICGNLKIRQRQIHELQQCFTQLKSLNTMDARLTQECFGTMAEWGQWSSLTDLKMFILCPFSDFFTQEMTKVFPCLPSLTRLEFIETRYTADNRYTWKTLEIIHTSLPRLKYLVTSLLFSPVLAKDISEIKQVVPADCMTDLTLSSTNMDIGWLIYYSLKYPKLEKLILSLEGCRVDQPEDDFQNYDTTPLLKTLPDAFLHIKTIEICQTAVVSKRHDMFWQLFQQFIEHVKDMKYILHFTNLVSEQPQGVLDECVQLSSASVENLDLFIKFPCKDEFNLSMKLGVCSRLVDLKMKLPETVVELDVLLNNCPALKNIQLDDVLVRISRDTSEIPKKHCLETIFIEFSKVNSLTFGYISRRCIRLRSMTLSYVNIYGSTPQYTGNLIMDMSWSQFEVLKLNGMTYRDKKHSMKILAIERIHATPQAVHSDDGLTLLTSMLPPVNQRLWFHLFSEDQSDTMCRRVRILDKKQAMIARDYYTAFLSSIWNTNKKAETVCDSDIRKKPCWRKDLSRGHVTLRCGYVGQYSIESVDVDHNVQFL